MSSDKTFSALVIEDNENFARMKGDQLVSPLRHVVEEALAFYSSPITIAWTLVKSLEEAKKELRRADRALERRGYDAVFCDLVIPSSADEVIDEGNFAYAENGLRAAAECRGYDWASSLIGMSAYSREDAVLTKLRRSEQALILFDEFVDKDQIVQNDPEKIRSIVAKLKRHVIPTEHFVSVALQWQDPVFFLSPKMKKVLRQLVPIAYQPEVAWPLSRLLLLGDAGSGKSTLATAFYQLLPKCPAGKRAECAEINCATLVSEGHGGRIGLFGCRSFGDKVGDQIGVFERASCYHDKQGQFAPPDTDPQYGQAGVAFLDEVFNLAPDLQASVLTAFEKGRIIREGLYARVHIGCHIVLATNADLPTIMTAPQDERADKVGFRSDLLDRVPYVIKVPSLGERKEEVEPLIRSLAAKRLRKLGEKNAVMGDISLAPSTSEKIASLVASGKIHSVRQLQLIAHVDFGEHQITDGNLLAVLQRSRALPRRRHQPETKEQSSLVAMATALQLPEDLWTDTLPPNTADAIRFIYERFSQADTKTAPAKLLVRGATCNDEVVFIHRLLRPHVVEQLRIADTDTSLNTARTRAAKRCGISLERHRSLTRKRIIEYLIGHHSAEKDDPADLGA